MSKPKKLSFVNGKRVLIDHDSRREEFRSYNKDRWKYQNDLMRFYNSKPWRTLSKRVLNENYYVCRACGGDATLADHIVPIRVDWERRLDKNNIQPLCDSCHTIKTKNETKK